MRIELIHPIVVHFAIGLSFTGVVVLIVGGFGRWNWWMRAGQMMLWLGAVALIVAAIFGDVAEDRIPKSAALAKLIDTHSTLGIITACLIGAAAVGWAIVAVGKLPRLKIWIQLLGLAGLVMVTITGFYGGTIVFDNGAAVQVNNKFVVSAPASQPAE